MKLLNYEKITFNRKIFQERAMNTQDALKEGFALYVEDNEEEISFFLYDTEKLTKENLISSNKKIERWLFDSLIGIAQMGNYSNTLPFKSWGVQFTAAEKGWGVLLYDIMLTQAGKKGLCPDRGSVSEMAEKVWEFYLTKRSKEIISKPIDDEDNPITSTIRDDGQVHKPFENGETDISKRSTIDRVYYLKPSSYVSFSDLEMRHIFFMNKLEEIEISKSKVLNEFNENLLITYFASMEHKRSGASF